MIVVENQMIAVKRSLSEMLYFDEEVHEFASCDGGNLKKRSRVTFDMEKKNRCDCTATFSCTASLSQLTKEELREICWMSPEEYQTIRSSILETIQAFALQQQQHLKIESDVCIRGIEHYMLDEIATERTRNRNIYRRMIILKHRLEQYQNTKHTNIPLDDPSFEQKVLSVFGSSANARAIIEECCAAQEVLTIVDAQKAHAIGVQDALEASSIYQC